MKATARAPANIAFIKYWGKGDPVTRVPMNDSISMNLSEMNSTTTVEFSPAFVKDEITFIGEETVTPVEYRRTVAALDAIRQRSGKQLFARVVTMNSFPKATGIASSASGFASLALAALSALGVRLEERELSRFCRTPSGTACRSVPDGFVRWQKGQGDADSYAYQLYPADYWEICDVIAIVTKKMKKVGSTEGHALAHTSPFYEARMLGMDGKILQLNAALAKKDFSAFGRILEEEAFNMHAICFTSAPPLIYWEPATVSVIKSVIAWREEGAVESYVTIDAGPSVHVMCKKKDAGKISTLLADRAGVRQVAINYPTTGVRLVEKHLF